MAQTEDQEPIGERVRRLEVLANALLNVIFRGDEKSRAHIFDLLIDSPISTLYTGEGSRLERMLEHGISRSPRFGRYTFEENLVNISKRVSAVRKDIDDTKRRFNEREESFEKDIKGLLNRTESIQTETHTLLALQALGLPAESVKLTRFLPVRVYIDDTPEGAVEDLTSAVTDLLHAFGFEISDEFPAIKGSWFQKIFAKSKDVLTQPEVVKRLEKIERAVEIAKISKPQAEADEKQAGAIAKLIKALEKTRNGAVQAGSVLVVKTTPSKGGPVIMARTLTQTEMIALENNQVLLQNPADLLSKLSEACATSKVSSQSYLAPSTLGGHVVPALPSVTGGTMTTKSDSFDQDSD